MFVSKDSSRRSRRWAVVVMYLGLAAFFTVLVVLPALDSVVTARWEGLMMLAFLIGMGLFALSLLVFSRLKTATQRVAEEENRNLDERQQAIRNGAYRRAYKIFTNAVILVLLYQSFAVDGPWSWLPQVENFLFVTIAFLWLASTLPTAIVAWNEPDPKEEQGEPERGSGRGRVA